MNDSRGVFRNLSENLGTCFFEVTSLESRCVSESSSCEQEEDSLTHRDSRDVISKKQTRPIKPEEKGWRLVGCTLRFSLQTV